MKKILVSLLTLAAVLVVIPMFAAWEAHVVNVTARIENALSVPTEAINFGTVFPQEELEKTLDIALSQSFLDEGRVDDVEYIIRQKPKCGVTSDDGTILVGPTWTGHINSDGLIDCEADEPEDLVLEEGQTAGLLPSLCEYISKHPDGLDDEDEESTNDGSLNSFHQPWTIDENGVIDWNDVNGRLAKSDNDTTDTWTIDLAVPCFGGFCAQDWENFVLGINPEADPDQYTQPIENEHKVFGCNLWVEVGGVSEESTPEPEATTLTVTKVVTNNNGGNAVIGDFTLSITGIGSVTSGVANDVAPGDYDVNEIGLGGYAAIFSGNCDAQGNVTVNAGDNLTCTITNDDIGPTITLVKNPVGGSLLATDFNMYVNGTPVPTGSSLGVNANANLAITEDPETGYTFTSLEGTGCPTDLAEVFQMDLAESITCTITNTSTS